MINLPRRVTKRVWPAILILATLLPVACGGPAAGTPTTEENASVSEPGPEAQNEPGSGDHDAGPTNTTGGRTFVIVPEESEASYIVEEEFLNRAVEQFGVALGLADTVGMTREIEGEFVLDLTRPFPLVSNHVTVNIRSLTSDQSRRDERIRERNLESNRFPLAEFEATAVMGLPDVIEEGETVSFQLSGDMTIREITHPVTFDVTASLDGDTITGAATTTMMMTDYGFEPPSIAGFFNVANKFQVRVTFTARESA